MNKLTAFYDGSGTDHAGRTLDQILAYSNSELEYHHDYIQWLFPLLEPSPVNPHAPTLDPLTIEAFNSNPHLRDQLRRAYHRMMLFYEDPQWLTPYNHNYLRLTRILTSTRLLGLTQESSALFTKLDALYKTHAQIIGPTSYAYWRRAAAG